MHLMLVGGFAASGKLARKSWTINASMTLKLAAKVI